MSVGALGRCQRMLRAWRPRAALGAAIALVAVISFGASELFAHGVVDQSNSASNSSKACGSPPIAGASLLQGFTPTKGGLSGVELLLSAGGLFPAAGTDVEVRIRTGPPSWEVISTRSARVTGPRNAGEQIRVHVDLARPAAVRPHQLHFIEWVGGGPGSILSWKISTENPYFGGSLFQACTGGIPAPTGGGAEDGAFATYFGARPEGIDGGGP